MSEATAFNVLFLSTSNSARSILAEAILNELGKERFRAFSAGSRPLGSVNPHALNVLHLAGHDVSCARSKSWDEFAIVGAPTMNFVFTVCGAAADEACPIWPGQPMTAHWGIPDPAAVEGDNARIALAFDEAYRMLRRRIELFVALARDATDHHDLEAKLADIGRLSDNSASAAVN